MLKTQDDVTATISLNSATKTTANSLLAYRPDYSLGAGIFVNIEQIFPCVANMDYVPTCSIFTGEEGELRKGKQFIELGGRGKDVNYVFDKDSATYGLVVTDCACPNFPQDCFPPRITSRVVCLLPRSSCQIQ